MIKLLLLASIILIISACVPEKITQENVLEIVAKMNENYKNISTLIYMEEATFKTKILSYEEFSEKSITRNEKGIEVTRDEKEMKESYDTYKTNLEKDVAEGISKISNNILITIIERTVHIKKPGKYIIDTPISKQIVVSTPDYNYIKDNGEVRQFPCPKEKIIIDYDFLKMLDSLTKKYDLTYIGIEEVSERKAYKFDLTYAQTAELSGKENVGDFAGSVWIDEETFMPLKVTSDPKGDTISVTEYSNYKINVDIPDSLFSAPPEVKKCF